MQAQKIKKNTAYQVPAVDGMLDIVEFMAEHQAPCGVTELSRKLDLSTNLVFRVMKRLVERGYVDVEGNFYQLNKGFYSLGMKLYSRFSIRNQARPYLETLCRETGETCQLQVPDGNRMLVMDVVTPDNSYYLQVVPGSRLYYHANAFGKCVLAYLPEERLGELLTEKDMPELTPYTITSLAKLKDELDEIRINNLGYDRNEYLAGIYCIGAPVFNADGKVVAGVGMTGLASRFNSSSTKAFKKAVRRCADGISQAIGYTK